VNSKGIHISPIEAIGNHQELLKKFVESGKELEIESLVPNEQWKRHDAKFFRGSSAFSAPQGGTGAVKKPFTPYGSRGYQGGKIDRATYEDQVGAVYDFFFDRIMSRAKLYAAPTDDIVCAVIEAAEKLAAQFPICVVDNLTSFDGAPVLKQEGSPGVSAPGSNLDTLPGESAAFTFLANKITTSSPPGVPISVQIRDLISQEIKQTTDSGGITKVESSDLYLMLYRKANDDKEWTKKV
jgi:hypothetical protein